MNSDTKFGLKCIGGAILFLFLLPVLAGLFYHWCVWVLGPIGAPMK